MIRARSVGNPKSSYRGAAVSAAGSDSLRAYVQRGQRACQAIVNGPFWSQLCDTCSLRAWGGDPMRALACLLVVAGFASAVAAFFIAVTMPASSPSVLFVGGVGLADPR
jgi:hypothetical protein